MTQHILRSFELIIQCFKKPLRHSTHDPRKYPLVFEVSTNMQRSGRWVKHRRQKCHDKKKLWLVVAVVVVVYVAAKSAELFQFFGRSERFVFQVENDLRTAKGSQNDLEKKQMQSLRPNRQWRSEAPVGYTLSFCWREPLWPLWRQRKANNTRINPQRPFFNPSRTLAKDWTC